MLIAGLLFVSVPRRKTEQPSHLDAFICYTWTVSLERSKVSAALPFYHALTKCLCGKSTNFYCTYVVNRRSTRDYTINLKEPYDVKQ